MKVRAAGSNFLCKGSERNLLPFIRNENHFIDFWGRFGAPFSVLKNCPSLAKSGGLRVQTERIAKQKFWSARKKANLFLLLTRACNYGKIKMVIVMEKNRNLTQPAESVKTKDILAASLKGFRKNHKVISGILIALAVLLLAVVISLCVLRVDSVRTSLVNSMMPATLTDEESGIVFYRENNPDYGSEENQQTIRVYYYPENDTTREKIYLNNGVFYNSDGEPEMYVTAGFTIGIMMKVQTIMDALGWAAAVLVVLVIVLLIVAWYRSFKKQEEERKAKYRNSHPRH